jgi:phage terminase large subunit
VEISRDNISGSELQEYSDSDRFIKIPIENYFKLIDIEPVPPQIALVNAIQNPDYRFIVAVLSRRTGKTLISNIIGHLITLVPGKNILIMAPNYSLSSISWELQRQLLNTFDIELERSNAKDKVIELKNGSTIRMGSVGQADSVVGRSYDLIIFDECALNNDGMDAFNIQLRPTLDKPGSKAIFISTPRGKNWFHEFYKRGFDENFLTWASIRSTYKDNPRASDEDISDSRASMSTAEFAKEYEADFIALEGQVYNLNKENIIEVDRSKLMIYDTVAGLDLGFRDPTAMVTLVTDGYNFYVVDEFLENENTTAGYAERIQAQIREHDIDFVYIDSAAQQTKFDLAMDYDISTVNAKKSVLDGIGYVASIIDHDRLFIDKNCKHTIDMLDNYRWDDKEGLLRERPLHNRYSHMADALRYALYSHSYNMVELGEVS